jgi:7-cyano-7-deazaguanine synthase
VLKSRAIVLLSGGLDSVVSLALADRELEVRLVLFFNYGQRSLVNERSSVVSVVSYFGLPMQEVDITWMRDLSPYAMRDQDNTGAAEKAQRDRLDSLDDVWIPNRNGVFLNVAAAYAERYGCDAVVAGFNREEAEEFPDNTPEYVDAVNRAFRYSTRGKVKVISYTQDLTKREILRRGVEVSAPLSTIWSCYRNESKMCGMCASCRRLRAAIDSLPSESRPVIEFAGPGA